MSRNMSKPSGFKRLGFIGLGAMGKPMVEHLANKLPQESRIWVYDVVEEVVDEMCTAFPERISKATSAKHVAEQTVCIRFTKLTAG
jgi:pyrroline-5-carboxylate reductase